MKYNEIQSHFDSEKIVEMALTKEDIVSLVNNLITLLELSEPFGHNLFVLHFLSNKEKQESLVSKNLKIQRLSSLTLSIGKYCPSSIPGLDKKAEVRRVQRVHKIYDFMID